MQMGLGSTMLQSLGHGSLYKGFSAGLLRKLSYATFLGSYPSSFILRKLFATESTGNAHLDKIIVWSGALVFNSVTMSALVLNLVEVVATRMQGDLALHPDLRRNHKNVLRAMYRAAADEGLLSLWRGTGPSVAATWAFTFSFINSGKYHRRIFHLNDKYSWGTQVTDRESRMAASADDDYNMLHLYKEA